MASPGTAEVAVDAADDLVEVDADRGQRLGVVRVQPVDVPRPAAVELVAQRATGAPDSSSTCTASEDASSSSARKRCSGRTSLAVASCASRVASATTRRAGLVNLSNIGAP